jgi:siderophore synthetase component
VPDDAAPPATLAEARAAVLARLWGALVREPLPGLTVRERGGAEISVKLSDGRMLRGDDASAALFAVAETGFSVDLDGVRYADPGALARAVFPAQPGYADELDNSVANLAGARATFAVDGGPPLLDRAAAAPDPLVHLEQSVVDGHPIHPGCRTRLGLSPAEVLAYAPEHRPTVDLVVVDVPPARWMGYPKPGRLLVHPWQYEHVLSGHPYLRDTGTRVPAYPLLSLRTLARADDASTHVKTAVDVLMTSAVRTVSPAAIHNGPRLSGLLAHLARLSHPGLAVLDETGGGAVLVEGEPSRSLAMLTRRMVALRPGELAFPLAALAAPSPADGRPLLAECVEAAGGDPLAWLRQLVDALLPPLLDLLRLGVALEAHGQNLLLIVRDGQPVRLAYRDFGGVRVSPARLRQHGIEPPPLRGDVITDDPVELRTKLFAAVGSTVLGEVAALMRRQFGVCAWPIVRAALASRPSDEDTRALRHDPWPIKAMTAMRLAADPLTDRWTYLPNPLEGE